jgi:hypothetical protein
VKNIRRRHFQRERRLERSEDRRSLARVPDDERLRHRDAERGEQLLARQLIERRAALLSCFRYQALRIHVENAKNH